MNLSPIALFIYKRPEHTIRTLKSLMKCAEYEDSPLYIYCDGAKDNENQELVEKTRLVAKELVGDKAIFIESKVNKGLANSIILGVTQITNKFGKVIVLEDDLTVSPYFLTYMNSALDAYEHEQSVMQVSGFIFPTSAFSHRTKAMFFPFTVSWGWATWKRAWDKFDSETLGWEELQTNKEMRKRFNLDGYYDYAETLNLQKMGKVDSWAVRWYWSVFSHQGYAVFPPISYVDNTGVDGSGTHSSNLARLFFPYIPQSLCSFNIELPREFSIDEEDYKILKKAISKSGYTLRFKLGSLKRKLNLFSNSTKT